MRNENSPKVPLNAMSLLNRSVLVAAVVLAGGAFAQPTNDTCANAEALVVPTNGTPVLSTIAPRIDLAAGTAEASLSCNTGAKNTVWYSFVAPTTGNYVIESCDTATNYDSVLAVYTGSCASPVAPPSGTACVDQGCPSGSASRVVLALTQGTQYYAQLAVWSSSTPTNAYVGQIRVVAPLPPSNDTCDPSVPEVALNRTVSFVSNAATANDGQVGGNLDGGAGTCFLGVGNSTTAASNLSPGRDVVHRFTPATAGRYNVRLTSSNSSVNSTLHASDSCIAGTPPQTYAPPQCIAASNRTSSLAEQLACVPLAAGQPVYLWADETALSAAGQGLSLDVSRCIEETEPNDTPVTASALSCTVTGGIRTAGDVDFFALGGAPAGSRVFALVEAAASNSTNFDLRVTTSTRTLEYDDSNAATAFGDSSGLVCGTPLTGAPAYLRVTHNSSSTIAEPYTIYSKIEVGAPSPEIEPNETVATATGGSLYFSGSIQDGGTDVDFFSVSANEGDIIFAALDSVPDRNDAGTTASFNLTLNLFDSTGALLVSGDDSSTTVTLAPNPDAGLTAITPTVPGDALVWRARSTGTYALRVGKTSGTTVTAYGLSVSVGCADAAPTLTNFTPTSGVPTGGQAVTLTGTNFSVRSVVRFGTGVASVDSISPTELVVRTPASATGGDVSVTVTNGVGLVATASGPYTYEDPPGVPPTLTGVSPTSGRTSGGALVTLTGTVFRADAGVFFEVEGVNQPATAVTRNSTTQLVATTPAHAAGSAVVRVVNTDGLSAQLDGGFLYLGPPTIATVTPNSGLTPGGQLITVTGTNFRAGTTVTIGGTAATSVTPATDGLSLTTVTPSSSTNGVKDVVVTTSDGQTATLTGGFTYNYAPPTLASVSPASGFASGNTLITLTGANFLTAPTVTVGGVAATGVNRTSSTSVTARTPAGSGVQPVVLTNSDGQATTATVNFTYVPAPTVASISPSNGSALGGTRITISGTDFTPGARVTIGGVPAFAVAVSSATTLTATTNSGAPGTYDVVVTNPDTQSATLAAGFTLEAAPLLTSLSPIGGSTAGGTVVTLTGSGFRQGAEVIFGSTPATAVTVVSDTELTATTAMHPLGVVSVSVRNQDGQSAELARSFRFVDPPSLTAIAPTSGDAAGGTTVRLTGAGFSQAATVTFGGAAASQVTLISATELDVVTPSHAAGAVDVAVTVDGATATLAGAFTYTRGAPSVAAAAPRTGPIEGGTLVTITGSGFADGATVTFGGTAATSVVVASADLIRAVAPAHAAGVVDLVVTNDDSQAGALSGGFTYTAASGGPDNSITDGGSGAVGTDPSPTPTPGGVSCGCTSFDGSMFGFAGLGLVALLSRRRRRS